MLAARELSAAECRERLIARGHDPEEVAAAVGHLQETGGLDDRRVALALARTWATVKGRGRLRVQRELASRGIDREVASAAIGEVFGDLDERRLVNDAIRKRLRGRTGVADRAEAARLYQYLLRQGFPPAIVQAAVRRLTKGALDDDL